MVATNSSTSTTTTTTTTPYPPSSPAMAVFTCAFCAVGILGNALALSVLHRARSNSNKRHVFMLRCLVANDCIALVGKFGRTLVKHAWPSTVNDVWMCRSRILFRFFPWGSGCAATVMAIDRWLALTKPFFYLSNISFHLLKRMMVILWLEVLCLVFLPFFGLGLYWDENLSKCERLRNAKKTVDVIYAYFYFSHGVILYSIIGYTNLAVMIALCTKNTRNHNKSMRRISGGTPMTCNAPTKEERSFAWLMCWLCVGSFILCTPELLTIMLNMYITESAMQLFNKVADVFLAIHFMMDPYMNVLYHWRFVQSICSPTKNNENVNSGNIGNSSRTTNRVSSPQVL